MATTGVVGKITLNGTTIPISTSPYIGDNGNWFVWNATTQKYVDSNISARIAGEQGPQGVGIKAISPQVSNDGKVTFTLADPSRNGAETSITTNKSVQGKGITDIVSITDETDPNYRKLQFQVTNPIDSSIETFYSEDTVIPMSSWSGTKLNVEVGGNTVTSPDLQGVGIDTTNTSVIDDDGKLVLTLKNPSDGTTSTISSDKSIQGIGIGSAAINDKNQLVITFIDPRTGEAPTTPTTLTTSQIIPTCTWNDTKHTLTVSVGGKNYTSSSLQGKQGIQGIQGEQGIYVSSGEVNTEGVLTFHLTDPSGQSTPDDIVISGHFTGPQGKNITDIAVTDEYKLEFTLYDPATKETSTLITAETIKPTSVNNIAPVGNNVNITGADIPVSADDSTSIATKIANVASVSVKSTTPQAASPAPTDVEKLGVWVDRTTGLAYVYDADNSVWITLGAVWK